MEESGAVRLVSGKERACPQLVTAVYLAAMVTFFLLFTGTAGYGAITLAKYQAFCALTGGYVLVMLALGLVYLWRGGWRDCSLVRLIRAASWPQRLVILFWIFTVLSTVISPQRADALIGLTRYEGLLTISLYVSSFLLVSVFARPGRWLLYLLGVAMAVFCVVALMQLGGLNPWHLYPVGYDFYDAGIAYPGAYLGTIGNVDLVAAVLCVVIPLFWASVLRLTGRVRYWLLLPLALCLVTLALMDVKAGLVGVFLGGLLSLPVVFGRLPKIKKLWLAVVLSVLAALVCLVFFYDFGGSGTGFEAHELIHGRWENDYGSTRIFIWRSVLDSIVQNPWWGGGPDTLAGRLAFDFIKYDDTGAVVRSVIDVAHNEYLNIWVNQGLLALGCYAAALISSLQRWFTYSANKAVAILGCAVVAYAVQAFFGLSMCLSAPFFWLAWGLLESACRQYIADNEHTA